MRSFLLYTKLIAIYTVFGVSGILVFMYFINLSGRDVDFASQNDVFRNIGRVAYRSTNLPTQYICGRFDPQLGYIWRPGECRYEQLEYEMLIQFNSAGLRDDETSLHDPEVVILGDSHAMGEGVPQDETFAALLEKMLGLKVLNSGVSSYATAREMMLFRRLGNNNADYIIIQYCNNDFSENKRYFNLSGQLNVMSEEKYENLVSIAKDRHKSFAWSSIGVVKRAFEKATEVIASLVRGKNEEIDEVLAFKYVISNNKDLLKGKKIIILEINPYNNNDDLFINRAKWELSDLDLDLHFIDVSQFLTDGDYYVLDNHMTASGHRKVAEAIFEVIRAQRR